MKGKWFALLSSVQVFEKKQGQGLRHFGPTEALFRDAMPSLEEAILGPLLAVGVKLNPVQFGPVAAVEK